MSGSPSVKSRISPPLRRFFTTESQARLSRRTMAVVAGLVVAVIVGAFVVIALFDNDGANFLGRAGVIVDQSSSDNDEAAPALAQEHIGDSTASFGAYGQETTTNAAPLNRKVIRTAEVRLRVTRVAEAVAFVRNAATAAGGYVSDSATYFEGDHEFAQVTIQVPFDRFDAVMTQLRQAPTVDRVLGETVNSQDVTEEFVDAEARVRNLQATEASYLALLNKATRIEDIISIQTQLTEVRSQIETLQGRLKYLTASTDLSTIAISLSPVSAGASESSSSFRSSIADAWRASLDLLAAVGTGVVRAIVFFWWLVPLAFFGFVLLRGWRRYRGIAHPVRPDVVASPPLDSAT